MSNLFDDRAPETNDAKRWRRLREALTRPDEFIILMDPTNPIVMALDEHYALGERKRIATEERAKK